MKKSRISGRLGILGRQSGSHASRRSRRPRFETLEHRLVMAAPTLDTIPTVSVPAGASLLVRLNGHDTDGDTLSFSATAGGSLTTSVMPSTNPTIRMMVKGFGATPTVAQAMDFQLFSNLAPKATARILQLINQGFYNHGETATDPMTFHRVVKDFMIQGGDPKGNGTGGSGLQWDDEFNADLRFTSAGILAMAKSNDDTNDSQFFITGAATRHLDFNHSIFGFLVAGDDVREAIDNVAVVAQSTGGEVSKPTNTVIIESISVVTDHENGVLMIKAPKGASGTGTVTVTVSDGHGGTVEQTIQVTIVADTSAAPPFLGSIADVRTVVNTNKSITLPATSVNGAAVNFDGYALDDKKLSVNFSSRSAGQLTIKPASGVAGVFGIIVGVQAAAGSDWDTQEVPVFVHPAKPTSIQLVDAMSPYYTTKDNTAGKTLKFKINGVLSGTEVKLFADGNLIGQATATGTSVTITTNGQYDMADGTHTITAVQTLKNQAVNVGNRNETTDLASEAASVQLTVDTAIPRFTSTAVTAAAVGIQYAYNSQTNATADDRATFKLIKAPSGMTVDAAGRVRWTPQTNQWPSQEVLLRVTDRAGNRSQQAFTISVADTSQDFVPNPVIDLPASTGGNQVTLRRNGAKLELVNSTTNLLLFAQPLNRTMSLQIKGGAQADHLTVDFAAGGSFTLANGLGFHGGGGTDTLTVHGGKGSDTIVVNGEAVTANGLRITRTSVERLRLEGDAGANTYRLISSTVPVAVTDSGGVNTLNFSGAAAGVTVNLGLDRGQAQRIAPWNTTLSLHGMMDHLTGTSFADVLIGNSARNLLRGGGGNDVLRGGGGSDVLVGGDGNDKLYAGSAYSLLIGGRGTDLLQGGTGGDTLVGGTTSYDNNDQALLSILSQGTVRGMFALSRRRFLATNAPTAVLKMGSTVQDDGARNQLFGGGGHDWYLPGRNDAWR